MSFANINKENLGRDLNGGEGKSCGCGSRKCKFWIPVLILALLVLVVIVLVLKFGKRFSEPYKMGMALIRADKQVEEAFGQPVRDDSWMPPGGELSADEAKLYLDLAGPKGKGKANINARKMQGKWEIVMVEVTLPDGKKIVLRAEGGANEAPTFNAQGAAAPEKAQDTAPLPDLTPDIPSLPEETEPKK